MFLFRGVVVGVVVVVVTRHTIKANRPGNRTRECVIPVGDMLIPNSGSSSSSSSSSTSLSRYVCISGVGRVSDKATRVPFSGNDKLAVSFQQSTEAIVVVVVAAEHRQV